MVSKSKRDSAYWLQRLEKDGRNDLIARIQAGEVTVYRATQIAGYRRRLPPSPAGKLAYHWERADHTQRKAFVTKHLKDVNRILKEVAAELTKLKREKSGDGSGK